MATVRVVLTDDEVAYVQALGAVRGTTPDDVVSESLHRLPGGWTERREVNEFPARQRVACTEAAGRCSGLAGVGRSASDQSGASGDGHAPTMSVTPPMMVPASRSAGPSHHGIQRDRWP